jgi:hypothetical protein
MDPFKLSKTGFSSSFSGQREACAEDTAGTLGRKLLAEFEVEKRLNCRRSSCFARMDLFGTRGF